MPRRASVLFEKGDEVCSSGQTIASGPATLNRMKFVNLYLVGYVVLVMAAIIGLWKTGILQRLSPMWIVVMVLAAIGVGIMMAVSSGKPTGPTIT